MRQGDARKRPSLSLFAALQFVWILLAMVGLVTGVRDQFGVKIDEQVWMFGLTLPLTLVSMHIARLRDWRQAPAMIAISSALHFLIYFVPLFVLLGAHLNLYALTEIAGLVALFAGLYTLAIVTGLLVFRLFKKEPAT